MDIIGTLEGGDPGAGWAVAGVDDATKDHTLVRKGYPDGALQGNGGDWVMSAGTDSLSSEWLVEERPTADYTPSTLGEHSHGPPPEPCTTNVLTFNMYDNWGDGWNGNEFCINSECTTLLSGSNGTDEFCIDLSIENPITCDGGLWQSEVFWVLSDSYGTTLATGGAPFEGCVGGSCENEIIDSFQFYDKGNVSYKDLKHHVPEDHRPVSALIGLVIS